MYSAYKLNKQGDNIQPFRGRKKSIEPRRPPKGGGHAQQEPNSEKAPAVEAKREENLLAGAAPRLFQPG